MQCRRLCGRFCWDSAKTTDLLPAISVNYITNPLESLCYSASIVNLHDLSSVTSFEWCCKRPLFQLSIRNVEVTPRTPLELKLGSFPKEIWMIPLDKLINKSLYLYLIFSSITIKSLIAIFGEEVSLTLIKLITVFCLGFHISTYLLMPCYFLLICIWRDLCFYIVIFTTLKCLFLYIHILHVSLLILFLCLVAWNVKKQNFTGQ